VSDPQSPHPERATAPASLPRRLWRRLRSVRLAVVLMGLIALACVVGTLIKQEPYDPAQMMEHYGRRVGALVGLLGLNQLYHTGWFIALLGLFALSTIACALSRMRLTTRSIGFTVVHLSIVFVVAGAIVKGAVGVEGVVEIAEGATATTFRTDAGELPLGFALRLDDFAVRRHEDWIEKLLVRHGAGEHMTVSRIDAEPGQSIALPDEGTTIDVLRKLPGFEVKDGRVHPAPDASPNPALEVRVRTPDAEQTGWLLMKKPGFYTEADLAAADPHGHLAEPDVRRYGAGDDVLLVRLNGELKPKVIPVEVGKVVALRPDGTSIEVLRRLPHFVSSRERIYSASDQPVNPAVEVRVSSPAGTSKRWLFLRFPGFQGHGADPSGLKLEYGWRPGEFTPPEMRYAREPGPVKAFESHVAVLDDQGQVTREATIKVNSPVKVGRYTLYQLSYDPKTEASSTLEVVHDPGVPFVFAGFLLMPLGIAFVFYIQPLMTRRKRADV